MNLLRKTPPGCPCRCLPWLLPALLVLGLACSPERPPAPDSTPPPVVIVALDGLSWQVAGPLADRGEMPVLSGLARAGAAGRLETARPTWTPLLFTTMATGKEPGEHGISTFVSDQGIPLTSNLRRVPALWTILTEQGAPSLFFGWPVTWPAEEVLGEMISDRWHKATERQVYPASSAELLAPDLRAFREQWSEPPPDLQDLARLATPDRVSPYLHGSFEAGDASLSEEPDRLVRLTRQKVESGFLWNAALDSEVKLPLFLRRLGAVRPRLSAVYFNATDMAQHFFGGADRPGTAAEPERNVAGREVIEETYRVYDMMLGRVVAGVRQVEGYENCVFVVLSDHGIDLASGPSVRLRPPAGQADGPSFLNSMIAGSGADGPATLEPGPDWSRITFPPGTAMAGRSRLLNRLDLAGCAFHPEDVFLYFVHNEAPAGVVVVSGGPLASGQPIVGMGVEDVAPTVLALLGLPVGADMAGRPARLLLEQGPGGEPRPLTAEMIPTHGNARQDAGEGEAISSPEDQSIRDELQALGYIE